MNENINEILATKRAWRKGDKDRRHNKEERRSTADAIRRGREIEARLKPSEKVAERSAFIMLICMVLAVLLMVVFCQKSHAYTVDQYATAIGKAENSKSHPYGIMTRYWHTTPRQACINTIRHYLRDWRKSTQETGLETNFLPYLARHYAPIGASNDPNGLNRNWIRNVRYFLGRE